jgi:hypothetical protein
MKMRWLAAAALALASGALAQTDLDSTPGLNAARGWLADLDAGRYGTTWENADPLLKESMPKVTWETGLDKARAPLGVALTRKLRQAGCTRGTQADPEAEICLIQYDTQFENRMLGDERLTVLRGRDGTWRVASYALR